MRDPAVTDLTYRRGVDRARRPFDHERRDLLTLAPVRNANALHVLILGIGVKKLLISRGWIFSTPRTISLSSDRRC